MKSLSACSVAIMTLFALGAPVRAQSVFYDTFSGVLQDDTFLDLSGWRTSDGSFNGGQFGRTSINYSDTVNGATISATASTVAPGFFTARNYASINVANSEEARYSSQSSHGTRTTVRFTSESNITPVRSRFRWNVSGVFSSSTPGVTGGGSLNFVAGNFPTTGYYNFFDLPSQEAGGPRLVLNGPGIATYDLPISLNQNIDLFYWSAASVGMAAPAGSSFSGFADYRNTHILERVDLYDANDHLIPSWGMVDLESGLVMFDQNGRTTAANAPEPGALALLTLGGAALFAGTRKRKKGLR